MPGAGASTSARVRQQESGRSWRCAAEPPLGLRHRDRAKRAVLSAAPQAKLHKSPLVTVAAVRGHCPAGGCILALTCDSRVVTEDTKMGLNEVALGIPVPLFWVKVMAQQIGAGRADALLQTATFVGAAEAKALGMVDAVVSTADLMATATKARRRTRPRLDSFPHRPFAASPAHRLSPRAVGCLCVTALRPLSPRASAHARAGDEAATGVPGLRPHRDEEFPPEGPRRRVAGARASARCVDRADSARILLTESAS